MYCHIMIHTLRQYYSINTNSRCIILNIMIRILMYSVYICILYLMADSVMALQLFGTSRKL